MTDKLINLVLTDPTYLSQAGLCRVLAHAMNYTSPETLQTFMTKVGKGLKTVEESRSGALDNTHQVEVLAAALKRDKELDKTKPVAAIHLIDTANQGSGKSPEFHALLLPAFLSASNDDHQSLVQEINRYLVSEGKELRRHGLEVCRLLLASSDQECIDAVENENLFVSIRTFEKKETDKELLRMAEKLSGELEERLEWIGRIPANRELLPPGRKPPFDQKISFEWDRQERDQ